MARQRSGRDQQLATRVAQEAARLIHEDGMRDYGEARRKAARRLQVRGESALPDNSEIEQALRGHLALFAAGTQPQRLRELREAAVEAMVFLAPFEPRLVGTVLDGTADRYSSVCLHLFADDVDTVGHHLDEHGIRFDREDRKLQLDPRRTLMAPTYLFIAGGVPMELTVLPIATLRQAPLDRDGHRPMVRASLSQVRGLLAEGMEPSPR